MKQKFSGIVRITVLAFALLNQLLGVMLYRDSSLKVIFFPLNLLFS